MSPDADKQPSLDELLQLADERVAELAAKYDTLDRNAADSEQQLQQIQHEVHNIRYAQLMAVLSRPDGHQKFRAILCENRD